MQPLNLLKGKKILFGVLRHELIHAMIDGSGKGKIPKWFNESFAIYVSGELNRVKKEVPIKFKTIGELEALINSKDYRIIATSYYYLGLTMQFLVQQYGEEKIKSLLAIGKTDNFENSFKPILGEAYEAVEKKIISSLAKF